MKLVDVDILCKIFAQYKNCTVNFERIKIGYVIEVCVNGVSRQYLFGLDELVSDEKFIDKEEKDILNLLNRLYDRAENDSKIGGTVKMEIKEFYEIVDRFVVEKKIECTCAKTETSVKVIFSKYDYNVDYEFNDDVIAMETCTEDLLRNDFETMYSDLMQYVYDELNNYILRMSTYCGKRGVESQAHWFSDASGFLFICTMMGEEEFISVYLEDIEYFNSGANCDSMITKLIEKCSGKE